MDMRRITDIFLGAMEGYEDARAAKNELADQQSREAELAWRAAAEAHFNDIRSFQETINERPEDTAQYIFIRKHNDGAGDIQCNKCGMYQIIYGEYKERLRKHTMCCKYCGARFTGLVKEEDIA